MAHSEYLPIFKASPLFINSNHWLKIDTVNADLEKCLLIALQRGGFESDWC